MSMAIKSPLPADGAPSTGHPTLDILTTALGLHLMLDPAVVDLICWSWLENAVPTSVTPPTFPQHLIALVHRLLHDTHQCDLGIFAIPCQTGKEVSYSYHFRFFPDRSDLGIVSNLIEARPETLGILEKMR